MNTDIIKLAKELKEAREKATQGKWYNLESTLSWPHRRSVDFYTSADQPITYEEHERIKQANTEFIALAANKTHILAEACIIMMDALEKYSDLHHAPALEEAIEKVKGLK